MTMIIRWYWIFFADDENGDDDTHTIVNVLSQYPVVATMYPVRVTELVAEIEKKFQTTNQR
ncbi:hypothetical protein OS11_38880 [Dickeya oryzae]